MQCDTCRSFLQSLFLAMMVLVVTTCEPDRLLLKVTVHGQDAEVWQLRLSTRLNQETGTPIDPLLAGVPGVVLELASSAQGELLITIEGVSRDGCRLSVGTATVSLPAERETTLTLTPLPNPEQYLTVTLTGSDGTVASGESPPKLSCSVPTTSCGACYPRGSSVTLSANIGHKTYQATLSGSSCAGGASCSLTMDSRKQVAAFFSDRDCEPGLPSLCWYYPPKRTISPYPFEGPGRHVLWISPTGRSGWIAGNDGMIARFDGTNWVKPTGASILNLTGSIFLGISGMSDTDVWAVGWQDDPMIKNNVYRWNGSTWSAAPGPLTKNGYRAVCAVSASEVWIAADLSSEIARCNGASCTKLLLPSGFTADAVFPTMLWGASASDLWLTGYAAVGTEIRPRLAHFTGSAWEDALSKLPSQGQGAVNLGGVGGTSASDVLMVSEGGLVYQYDGSKWSDVSGLVWGGPPSGVLKALWVTSKEAWIGGNGLFRRSSGGAWQRIVLSPELAQEGIVRIRGVSSNDAWMMTSKGALLRYKAP